MAVGWDMENRKEDGKRIVGESLAVLFSFDYALTEEIALIVGFGRTLGARAQGGSWEFERGANDWATGAGAVYAFSLNERVSVGPSLVAFYDFDPKEIRVEAEFAFAYAF